MLLPDNDTAQLSLFDWAYETRLEEAKEYGFGGFDEDYTDNTDITYIIHSDE